MLLSNQDIANCLRRIPQSNQPAAHLSNLTSTNQSPHHLSALYGICKMLALFGIVSLTDHDDLNQVEVQASSQTAKYTLMSLAEYLSHNMPIIAEWEKRGIQDFIFTNGATFLQALEKQRTKKMTTASPSRYVIVAQVLIKRINPETHEHEILMQYDENAKQYQLIGGRWSEKDGDNIEKTIIREIEEELPLNNLPYPSSYQLQIMIENLTIEGLISSTFGAITQYEFSLYHMNQLNIELSLQPEDQWIPIRMLLNGNIEIDSQAYPLRNPNIFKRIDKMLPNGLMGLPISRK